MFPKGNKLAFGDFAILRTICPGRKSTGCNKLSAFEEWQGHFTYSATSLDEDVPTLVMDLFDSSARALSIPKVLDAVGSLKS